MRQIEAKRKLDVAAGAFAGITLAIRAVPANDEARSETGMPWARNVTSTVHRSARCLPFAGKPVIGTRQRLGDLGAEFASLFFADVERGAACVSAHGREPFFKRTGTLGKETTSSIGI